MSTLELFPLKKSIRKTVMMPGSKSYTNRALLLAAMTRNTVKIFNPLYSDDTKAMISCLQKLGIEIKSSQKIIEVIGSIYDIKNKKFELNADLSGTTLRFLLPLLTIIPGVKILKGKEGLNKRPIKDLVNALIQLGANIEYLDKEGFPPVQVNSSKLAHKTVGLDGEVSSQYFSALLMIGPLIDELTINVKGTQISKPYIDMTIDIMKNFGVRVINHDYKKYTVLSGQRYHANAYSVEGDFSSAGYFFAIAALTRSTLTLQNLNPDSVQADKNILKKLKHMGNKVIFGKNKIIIKGNGVKPITVDVTDFPDQAQTLAVLAAFAQGKTKLEGIQSLRIKETNRVSALRQELGKMGIKTVATKTSLTIFGDNPKSAVIDTYGDHRMAMSFAIAGVKINGIVIKSPEVVTKTFPDFWEKLKEIGISVKLHKQKKKIVLIGFMGSGKSSIAPLLAKSLKFSSIEMDQLTLNKSNEDSIAHIFEKFGEKHFRNLEQQVAESLIQKRSTVISAGGGVVMNQRTIDALSKNSIVIFLSTEFETLQKRLEGTKDRPLWNDINKTKKLFKLRQPLYKKAATNIIYTDNKSPIDITQEIIKYL